MRTSFRTLVAAAVLVLGSSAFAGPLEDGFREPPNAAKPRIWWFWGESITTDKGITKDLESLQRVGFGGVVLYEQVFADAPDALRSLSPEWLDRVKFAAGECSRLGLAMEVNASNGYVAGGPWITPALGMQRLVGSETIVEGGKRVEVSLPQPPTRLDYYRDVVVLAYPTPANGGESLATLRPTITSNTPGFDAQALFDPETGGTKPRAVRIKPREDRQPVLVSLDFGRPTTLRSISYNARKVTKAPVIATEVPRPFPWRDDFYGQNMQLSPILGQLEASRDGQTWERLCDLPPMTSQHDTWPRQTVAFPTTTARWFRLNLHDWGRSESAKDDELGLTSIDLAGEARVDQWERKSGNVVDLPQSDRTPRYAGNEVIDPDKIVDVTASLDKDGMLRWDAPAGRWTILRVGHTPTGAKTKHGRPETMGLECDKLSAEAARVQFENYAGKVLAAVRTVPRAKLAGVQMDSAEHGSQNWTPRFRDEFRRLRGYDPLRFLPAMLGRVVGDRERSDRFLFDVRRTIADLMSGRYYGTFRSLCEADGMTFSAEAPGIATCLPSDNFQAKGRTDVPMGEFWVTQPDGTIDCLEAAQAAHVYGKTIAAAEAFTGSKGEMHPAIMKPLADAAMALGINRFYPLAYIHQPWDDGRVPGVTQDRFYLPYQRNNTWWEQGAPFWNTLARSAFLLQQGKPAVDLLYHLGNDAPLKITTFRTRPVPPAGYAFDACGDEVLLDRLSVRDGRLTLPDGMSYRMLVLASERRMTLAALRKVRDLVADGAIVYGERPTGMQGGGIGEPPDDEFRRLADELWGSEPAGRGDRGVGKGRVTWGVPLAEALTSAGAPPDFGFRSTTERPADLLWAHRREEGRDLYFVANHLAEPSEAEVTFRVAGKAVELWYPETGKRVAAAGVREADGRTSVPIKLEANESVFVVFRPAGESGDLGPAIDRTLLGRLPVKGELAGPWEVSFPAGRGAPERMTQPQLVSWTEHADEGIKHFSGTATYTNEFSSPEIPAGQRVMLDLGRVEVIARVKVNGRDLGVLWKPPYAVDVTDALRPGANRLEVDVTNTWVNRLIADSALPAERRVTWTTFNPYTARDALLPSGLIGPVRLRVADPR